MTPYRIIYNRFLSKIQDLELAHMSKEAREHMLHNWLFEALSLIEFDKLRILHDLSNYDDEELCFNTDLTNYEIEGIALYMMVAWYEDKVNSLDHTLLFMGSKDEKWTNQRDHWRMTREIQDSYRKRARKYFRNHASRFNEYINDDYDLIIQEANPDTEVEEELPEAPSEEEIDDDSSLEPSPDESEPMDGTI